MIVTVVLLLSYHSCADACLASHFNVCFILLMLALFVMLMLADCISMLADCYADDCLLLSSSIMFTISCQCFRFLRVVN